MNFIAIGLFALVILLVVIVWLATGERKGIKKKFAISAAALAVLVLIAMPTLAAVNRPYRPVEYSYSGLRWVDEAPDECAAFQLTLSGERSLRFGFRGTLTLSVEGEEPVVLENCTIRSAMVMMEDDSILPCPDRNLFLLDAEISNMSEVVASIYVRGSSWEEICIAFWEKNASGDGKTCSFNELYTAPAVTREEAVALTNEILGAMAEFEGVVWE